MPNTLLSYQIPLNHIPITLRSFVALVIRSLQVVEALAKSEDLAAPLLLSRYTGTAASASRGASTIAVACGGLALLVAGIVGDDCVNGLLEDLVDADHLFTAALHVAGVHLPCYALALLGGDGC